MAINRETYFTDDNIEKLNFLLKTRLDDYCLADGTVVHLDGLLHDYFKREMGYDNIVFFSPSKGLYFFDSQTYFYFCPDPNGTEAKINNYDAPSAATDILASGRKYNANSVDGKPTATKTATISVEKHPVYLRFVRDFQTAYPDILKLLKDEQHKNVVIIKDSVSFLESAGEKSTGTIEQKDEKLYLRNFDNMLFDRPQNRNILIWMTMEHDNISGYPYFRDRNSTSNTPQVAQDKVTVVNVSSVGVGEIKNLVNHYRLKCYKVGDDYVLDGLKVNFIDYDSLCSYIAEKILRYDLSLRDLSDVFENLMRNKLVLNKKNFESSLEKKLVELKREIAREETYEQMQQRLSTPEKITQYLKSVKNKAEGFNITEGRAPVGSCRLDPPVKSKFQELLTKQPNAFNLHLALVGDPGTGKTTFAKMIAKAYKELGFLPTEKFVKVTRADLVAGYVGQTAIKTKAKIDEAMGGTLFIDEAYTLARQGTGSDSFGLEAIDTLVEAMTDRMGEFAVIIAGYTNDINNMISANEGLRSRFSTVIEIKEYPLDVLVKKFKAEVRDYFGLKNNGCKVTFEDEFTDENIGVFLTSLREYYNIHKKNGRSSWASMRTVIRLADDSANNCDMRMSDGSPNSRQLLVSDMPELERQIWLTAVKSKIEQQNDEDKSVHSVYTTVREPMKKVTISLRQLHQLDKLNPMFAMVKRDGTIMDNKVFNDVYQNAVVRLFNCSGASGTGCVISPDGYILTAKHVAINVDKVKIFQQGGSVEYKVKPVKESEKYDLAIMKIDDDVLTPVYASVWQDGKDKYVEKGSRVKLLGYPFGMDAIDGPHVYTGLIAGVSIIATSENDMGTAMLNLQIEGKQGNSGSPLFNDNMEIVGVFVGSQKNALEDLVEEINHALPIKFFFEEFVSKE